MATGIKTKKLNSKLGCYPSKGKKKHTGSQSQTELLTKQKHGFGSFCYVTVIRIEIIKSIIHDI